jgi:HSP20 family protein
MSRDLTKYSNTGSVWDFMSEVERALDDVWRTPQNRKISANTAFTPAVDVHETDDSYLLSLDVPGIPQQNIKIESNDGRLTISGERSSYNTENNQHFKRVERSFGTFERSFQLPQNVDQEKIQARYENGVLEVMVPKAEMAKPKSIHIESEKGGLFSKLLGKDSKAQEKKPEIEKH